MARIKQVSYQSSSVRSYKIATKPSKQIVKKNNKKSKVSKKCLPKRTNKEAKGCVKVTVDLFNIHKSYVKCLKCSRCAKIHSSIKLASECLKSHGYSRCFGCFDVYMDNKVSMIDHHKQIHYDPVCPAFVKCPFCQKPQSQHLQALRKHVIEVHFNTGLCNGDESKLSKPDDDLDNSFDINNSSLDLINDDDGISDKEMHPLQQSDEITSELSIDLYDTSRYENEGKFNESNNDSTNKESNCQKNMNPSEELEGDDTSWKHIEDLPSLIDNEILPELASMFPDMISDPEPIMLMPNKKKVLKSEEKVGNLGDDEEDEIILSSVQSEDSIIKLTKVLTSDSSSSNLSISEIESNNNNYMEMNQSTKMAEFNKDENILAMNPIDKEIHIEDNLNTFENLSVSISDKINVETENFPSESSRIESTISIENNQFEETSIATKVNPILVEHTNDVPEGIESLESVSSSEKENSQQNDSPVSNSGESSSNQINNSTQLKSENKSAAILLIPREKRSPRNSSLKAITKMHDWTSSFRAKRDVLFTKVTVSKKFYQEQMKLRKVEEQDQEVPLLPLQSSPEKEDKDESMPKLSPESNTSSVNSSWFNSTNEENMEEILPPSLDCYLPKAEFPSSHPIPFDEDSLMDQGSQTTKVILSVPSELQLLKPTTSPEVALPQTNPSKETTSVKLPYQIKDLKIVLSRRHQCDLCNSNYSHIDSLNNHRRTHFGIWSYNCTLCPYPKGFKDSATLREHARIHHDVLIPPLPRERGVIRTLQ